MAKSTSETTLTFETNEGTITWTLDEHTAKHFEQLAARAGYDKAHAMFFDAIKEMSAGIAISLCLTMSPHLQRSRAVSD